VQVLTKILCMVASSDKLGCKRNAKGPSSLFNLACVHPRLDKLLCEVRVVQVNRVRCSCPALWARLLIARREQRALADMHRSFRTHSWWSMHS
jgi:hypothetical protein